MELHPLFAHLAETDLPQTLKDDASQDIETQVATHQSLVRSVFTGLDGVADTKRYWIQVVAPNQIARLHAMAARRVPLDYRDGLVSANPYQVAFLCDFVSSRWPDVLVPELELVLRTYVEQGYMDLQLTTVPNFRGGLPGTYLEAAMSRSNAAAVPILLELGSRQDMAPVHPFNVDLNGVFHEVAAGDFNHFMHVMYGANPEHPVRVAVNEGLRRRHALAMQSAMQEVIQGDEAVAAAVGRRRARL